MTAAPAIQSPDRSEAERFLAILDESAESFCFRVFDDNPARKDPRLAAKIDGALDDVWPQLLAKQAQGCGVYVVANAGEQTSDSIYKVRAVFADTDGAPLDPIIACGLEPHVIVESSPGNWHVYWLVDGLALDAFRDVQRSIAARFGTDKSVNDLSRVMRLPGLYHQKGEPFRSRIIHESGVIPYTAERILEVFPRAAPERPLAPSAKAGSLSPGVVIDTDRHADVVKCTLLLSQSVRAGSMTRQEAFDIMRARRDAGRYSRHVPDEEIARALDGAISKSALNPVAQDATAEKNARLVEVALADVMQAKPAPPRFVINPIIPRNVATLLGGHGGLGKSMLGLTLCAHVGAGRGWGPFAVEQGRAVFVSLEDPGELVRYRLRCIIDEYQLPAHEVLANLRVFDGADVDAALVAESRAAGVAELVDRPMLHEVATAATGASLLIIDNASDAYGADENARAQVRAFMRRLSSLARANDGGLVLLAHVDKSTAKHGAQGNSYSGSTAWHNSARSRLALVEEKGVVELRHEKANLSRRADPVILTYAEHGVPVPTAGGGSRDAAEAMLAGADADAVLEVLQVALRAGATITTASAGPATAWHALSAFPELGKTYRTAEGRRRVAAALVALERQGKIVRTIYQKPNRHQGERWAMADASVAAA